METIGWRCIGKGRKVCVFVGAFSGFGGLVYRIPAPIFGVFGGKSSGKHQWGVGVRSNDVECLKIKSERESGDVRAKGTVPTS
jgi:hypothetical protein